MAYDQTNNLVLVNTGAAWVSVNNPFGSAIDTGEITDGTITTDDVADDTLNGVDIVDSVTVDGASLRLGDGGANYSQFGTDGAMTYAGTAQPKRTIVLTAAGAIVSPSAIGCAGAACADQRRVDGSTFPYYTLDFDKDTAEAAYWQFVVPDSLTGTTATFTPVWTAIAGTSGGVVWQIDTGGFTDNETYVTGALGGTANTSTDTFLAVNKLHVGPAVTVTHDWTTGDLAVVEVKRLVANASDTFDADARLVMIKIEWTASAESD